MMLTTRRQITSVTLALLLFASSPTRADSRAGLAEFRAGRFSEAVSSWRSAAADGDAAAALYLGVMFDTGFGVPSDPAEALTWYRRAATGGNSTAMLNTGIMLDAGRGAGSDPSAALSWYERAAEAGSGRAAFDAGLLYEGGIGVSVNREQARRFYRLAVAYGVPEGRAGLARLGERQTGATGRATLDPAMVTFRQAQHVLLSRGPAGDTQAAELFRKAAEAGNALAAYNLGYCYEHGIGVPASLDEALTWYRRSAIGTSDPALRGIAMSGVQNLLVGAAHVQR